MKKNGNYEKVRTVVDEFIKEKLDKIALGAKTAAGGAGGDDLIANVKKNGSAVEAEASSVNSLVTGIKTIVGVVLKEDEGKADANGIDANKNKTVGNLLSTTTPGDATEDVAIASGASIGAVSGADILRAISKSGTANSKDINQATNAAEIAVANKASGTKTFDQGAAQKDAVIAAGIALRAMAKSGKFAAYNTDFKVENAVKAFAVNAVSKTLSALSIAVRNTVDSGLKKINEALAAVKQGDMLPETSESGAVK